MLALEELRAHAERVLLLALHLARPLRRQVVLHAPLPVLVVLQNNGIKMSQKVAAHHENGNHGRA